MNSPLEHIRAESGIHVTVVDFSNGGMLLESSPALLKYLLGDECPADVDDEPNYTLPHWQKIFEDLRKPMLHMTFYPKLYFPDAVKSYKPEMPFKFSVIGQVVRTHLRRLSEGQLVLQHGLQFAYESLGIPLEHNEVVPWRYTRLVRDNEHQKRVHTSLSQLYGYLENQSLSSATGP